MFLEISVAMATTLGQSISQLLQHKKALQNLAA